MGLHGTPGIPGLNGLTGRKVNIQMCKYYSLPQTYTNSSHHMISLQGEKGQGGINGADGYPGAKGDKVGIFASVSLVIIQPV